MGPVGTSNQWRPSKPLQVLLLGLVAGWLASFLVRGGGLVRYLITGLIGAYVGGYLFAALGINLGIKNALASQIVTATITGLSPTRLTA